MPKKRKPFQASVLTHEEASDLQRIKDLRDDYERRFGKGFQAAIARAYGVSDGTISHIFTGARPLNLEVALVIYRLTPPLLNMKRLCALKELREWTTRASGASRTSHQ